MRLSTLAFATGLVFTLTAASPLSASQTASDYVFTDDEGHLVLRYAGAEHHELDRDQIDEIMNVQLSTMVHDRLRADARFEAEPVDAEWAETMEPRIERHVSETAPEFSSVEVECRSASCRLLLDHASTRRVSDHQALMGVAQRAIRTFIEAQHAARFEPVFMIAGHYQEPERPYTKVFVRRAAD